MSGSRAQALIRFQDLVWDHYRKHRRPMPWRDEPAPYHVVVSEIMLQQTQVSRVLQKYPQFISRFPDFKSLASTRPTDVLAVWQGMGYNRRALNLQRIAIIVIQQYGGELPKDMSELILFPGIGSATAGSIAVFAFNRPEVFIETNIRRVFIHHFFAHSTQPISDAELKPLVEAALDTANPREWYYALMDYGTHLAKEVPNPNRRSQHYVRQSKFEGSDRQIRGEIIRIMLEYPVLTAHDIIQRFPREKPERVIRLLEQLTKEGFFQLH